ncbi:MAG: hypothetical protein AAF645_09100, partial [Myxococcota bacterium]
MAWLGLIEDDELLARSLIRQLPELSVKWIRSEVMLHLHVWQLGLPSALIVDLDLGPAMSGLQMAHAYLTRCAVFVWTGQPENVPAVWRECS